jgi:hypothetical protein
MPNLARALVFLIPIQAIVVVCLTVERLVTLLNDNNGVLNNDGKVAIVLIASYFPFTYNALDAILLENKYQLASFMVLNGVVLFYCAYDFIYDDVVLMEFKNAKLVRLVFVAICAPTNVLLGILAFRDFGWVAARTVGTSLERVELFDQYQRLVAFIKIDVQMNLTLLVFSALFVVQDVAFAIADGVLLALSLPWAFLLLLGVRRENAVITKACIIGGVINPTYVACRIAFYALNDLGQSIGTGRQQWIMLSMALLAIALRCGTSFSAIRVWLGFGGGLLEVFAKKTTDKRPKPKFATDDDPLLPRN